MCYHTYTNNTDIMKYSGTSLSRRSVRRLSCLSRAFWLVPEMFLHISIKFLRLTSIMGFSTTTLTSMVFIGPRKLVWVLNPIVTSITPFWHYIRGAEYGLGVKQWQSHLAERCAWLPCSHINHCGQMADWETIKSVITSGTHLIKGCMPLIKDLINKV